MDKNRLAVTHAGSKSKEGIGNDKPMFGRLEVKTRLANSVYKNKTETKGGKNEARTVDGENKALSGGLVDKTRLANNAFNKYQDRNGNDRHKPLLSGLLDKIRLGLTYSVSKNKEHQCIKAPT